MRQAYRKWLTVALIAGFILSTIVPLEARAAGDLRFFGDFCGPYTEPVEVRIPVWFWYVTRTKHINTFIKAHADYRENSRRNGLAHGRGRVEVKSHTIPGFYARAIGLDVGDTIPFVFAGRITERGRLAGSGLAPGREPTRSVATLSDDGLELEMRLLDRTVTLRKDLCGNTPPTVSIDRPRESSIPWRRSIQFTASSHDHEDTSFPDWRQRWESNLDGPLGTGRTIFRNNLTPGNHIITFTVIDSGGLSAIATKELTVENNFPVAHIDRPVAGGSYFQRVPITFRGRAYDRELGNLTGPALVWTTADGFLGSGNDFQATLEAGSHRIRLSATDGELIGRDDVTIIVGPRSSGNQTPGITITAPPDRSAPVGDTGEDDCVTLTAVAEDFEDGLLTGGSITWKDLMDGLPVSEARVLEGVGESVEACNFHSTGGDTWHTITATSTDSEGEKGEDSIRILVIGGGMR